MIIDPFDRDGDKDLWYNMCQITDRIWIGNAEDAMDASQMEKNGITAVLNVMRTMTDMPDYKEMDGVDYTYVQLLDGPGNTKEQFISAVLSLRKYLFDGHKVLVHCRAGISRSVSVVACYLWGTGVYTLEDAIDLIKEKRPIADPNPHLLRLIKVIQGRDKAIK
jgi:predicted protein tyrosine phosphatase